MTQDPCNLLPFADSEPVMPKPRHRAVHHVVGRIWRHRPQRLLPTLGPPDPSLRTDGCEAHSAMSGLRSKAAPRRLPPLVTPAVPLLAGTAIAGMTWFVIMHVGAPPGARHGKHGHPHVAVLEPSSLFLLLSGLAALAAATRFKRPRRGQRSP